MGSPATADLPPADSPSLVLTNPTPAELRRTWSLTHGMWGTAMPLDEYLRREEFLADIPLAHSGGLTPWIVTDGSLPPDARPILSSCESLRKRALVCSGGEAGAVVREGVSHGIASVFTDPQYRGRGYASRMLRELGARLRTFQAEPRTRIRVGGEDGEAGSTGAESLFSVLYSDIGKKFYAGLGWAAMPSSHVALPAAANPAIVEAVRPRAGAGEAGGQHAGARAIGFQDLRELCGVDERLVRAELARRAGTHRHSAAVAPDVDQMLWHYFREGFVTESMIGRKPDVRGAVHGGAGRRVWAIWMRGYYGSRDEVHKNTFHILRFALEDGAAAEGEAYLAGAVRAILEVAQAEAAEWHCANVQLWNPAEELLAAIRRTGLEHEFVTRDSDSIASLMWYGEGPSESVDWVINEKYAWC